MTFSWSFPLLREAHKSLLHIDQFGDLREKESCQYDLKRLHENWDRYKGSGSDRALLKAIFRTFACDWILQMIVNIIVAGFQFASPFIIIRLVKFIEDGKNV